MKGSDRFGWSRDMDLGYWRLDRMAPLEGERPIMASRVSRLVLGKRIGRIRVLMAYLGKEYMCFQLIFGEDENLGVF